MGDDNSTEACVGLAVIHWRERGESSGKHFQQTGNNMTHQCEITCFLTEHEKNNRGGRHVPLNVALFSSFSLEKHTMPCSVKVAD